MKKVVLAVALVIGNVSAMALQPFVEAEHQSVADIRDWGTQTIGVGMVHYFNEDLSASLKLAKPFTNYNDIRGVDGAKLDTGDTLFNARLKYNVLGDNNPFNVFVEAEHQSKMFIQDYGLQTVGLGGDINLTKSFTIEGKIATPVTNYNDYHTVYGNALEFGDPIGNARLRYTFGM
jgi:hypothetical protein